MSSGKSFYDQRGKVYLSEPMVAYVYKGRLMLRKLPSRVERVKTAKHINHINRFSYISRAWTGLTEKEQAGWEAYAEMVYDVRDRERQDVTGDCGGIIPRRRIPATGKGAFIQSNMLLYSAGLSEIRKSPPFNTGFPPAPTSVSLAYENGVAEVRWDDPIVIVGGVAPTIGKVRIWARFSTSIGRSHLQIIGVVDIPSSRVFTFDRIRMPTNNRGAANDMMLADFRTGMLHVQTDTVVTYGEGGAVRSVGSNTEKKAVRYGV